MDKAAPAAAGVAAEKKQPLLRRAPTALFVTLIGIALSAWLIPAFTRQWDDRQKAQQLKTAIVSDMASGTARALIQGEALWSGRQIDKTKVLDAWAVASLELESRLRAYFGSTVVTAWEIYSWLVDHFDGGDRAQAEEALITATTPPIHLDPKASAAIAQAIFVSDHMGRGARFPNLRIAPNRPLEGDAVARLRTYLNPYLGHLESTSGLSPGLQAYGPNVEEFALLAIQAEMTREISGTHAAGYSTNANDLLHNLFP
jgi:hypothetical protein